MTKIENRDFALIFLGKRLFDTLSKKDLSDVVIITTKGGSRRLEKSHKVWMMMMMMITASLMWAGVAEKPD